MVHGGLLGIVVGALLAILAVVERHAPGGGSVAVNLAHHSLVPVTIVP
jgi:hypothetical protein